MHCLLIDDDTDDQEVFVMILDQLNKDIVCTTTDSGVEALALLEQVDKAPDYIFIDVNMPKMNGVECLKHIKEQPRLDNCRVYMYSTTAEEATVQKVRELGAIAFLEKPASPSVLREMLSDIFNN